MKQSIILPKSEVERLLEFTLKEYLYNSRELDITILEINNASNMLPVISGDLEIKYEY